MGFSAIYRYTKFGMVSRGTQAIDIRTGSRLCFAILFGGGIARRAKGNGILGLPWFEVPSTAEVNQVEMTIRGHHDVGRLEIAEDDRWLATVQIV